MEGIKQLLANINTNTDGSVTTYFDGRITQTQLIMIIATIVIGLIILRFVKKSVKFIIMICLIGSIFFNVNFVSPDTLVGAAAVLNTREVKTQITKLANKSDSIKIENSDIQLKVADEWVSLNDITGLVQLEDGKISLNVGGKDIVIEDKQIIDLLRICLR